MKRFEEFSVYEISVVNNLINLYQYSHKEAISVVRGYNPVMAHIGMFDNPRTWAEVLNEAVQNNVTPDMWLKQL